MGLYNGNLGNYYATPSQETLGGYQFISITDIINNFRVAYVGEDKIIPKISRADIKFHAMRGLQELTYDTFRSCKTLELDIPPSLILPLPHDYVEYVKVSWIDGKGNCRTITQCKSCPKDPLAYKQHPDGSIDVGGRGEGHETIIEVTPAYGTGVFDRSGDGDRNNPDNWENWVEAVTMTIPASEKPPYQDPTVEDSTTWNNSSNAETVTTIDKSIESNWYWENDGKRYGLNTADASANGCFWINCRTGQMYFDSSLSGETVVIQYISDGLATDDEMIVHKFAEEAMYKHIAHSILNTRANTDPNLVATYKKERFAAIRNAKIRLSSIKLEEMAKILRGQSKWIKH